ncbi:MAG TPA: hypothetical protein VLU98_01455, partial [Methanomicrobiales archaeon]|nr:hypothetical protein [Methanomicrobiales archaeon]
MDHLPGGARMTVPDPLARLEERDRAVLHDPGATVDVLLEQVQDIPPLLSIQSTVRAELRLIATSPAVAWELGKRRVAFRGIGEFCDREAIVALGMGNFRKVHEICDLIDTDLGKQVPFLEESGMRPALDNFLFFKILYDGLSVRSLVLQSLIGTEKPDLLLCFQWDTGDPADGGYSHGPFSPDEHVFGAVLSSPGWSCPVARVPPGNPPPVNPLPKGRFGGTGDPLAGYSTLYNLAYARKRYGTGRALRLLSRMAKNWLAGGDRLLITGYAYDWHYLIPELYARGYRVSHLRTPDPDEMYPPGVNLPSASVEPFCRLNGIDLSGLFIGRAVPVLSVSVYEAGNLVPLINRRLDALKPVAVLCGARARSRDHLPNGVARRRGIPVLSWQHGA